MNESKQNSKLFFFVAEKVEDAVVPSQRKVSEYTLVNTIEGRRSDNNLLNEADFLFNAMCDSAALKKFLIKWQLDDKTLEFPVHLRNKCQVEGSQAVLKCLVNGKSPFNVRWYKGNNELFEGPKYFIRVCIITFYMVFSHARLPIDNLLIGYGR